jgi:hypothetical protein
VRDLHAALLVLAACVQACFMSGYETPRGDAGASVDGGATRADGGGTWDASSEYDAAYFQPADAAICPADDGGPDPLLCDGGSCTLPTDFSCDETCERPSCDPCKRCRLACKGSGCETNCLSGRNCVQECEGTDCLSNCTPGARCDVRCHAAESCRVVCMPGSTCSVDCKESNRCAVTCMPGANCELRCASAGEDCGYAECGGALSQCGGSEFCGGFGCPPP